MSTTTAGGPASPSITGYVIGKQLDKNDTMTGHVWMCEQEFTFGGKKSYVNRAIKVLKPSIASTDKPFGRTFLKDFMYEIQALLDLSHPNIVGVIGGGDTQLSGTSVPYYVMEYVKNAKDLRTFTDEGKNAGQLEAKQLLDLIRQLLDGVAAIHARKLVHMDLKPPNILVSDDGTVKITDLGFARSLETQAGQPGVVVMIKGTKGYLDPELEKKFIYPLPDLPDGMVAGTVDPESLDVSSDLYTLGLSVSEVAEKLIGDGTSCPDPLRSVCHDMKDFGLALKGQQFQDVGAARRWFHRSFLERPPFGEARHFPTRVLRIPELANVSLSDRIVNILNDPLFQRLRRVKQLGFVYLVYPGATHTRFEHCVGAYHRALKYLLALWENSDEFRRIVEPYELEATVLAALCHDIGQYPFAHVLEEAHLFEDLPAHAELSKCILQGKHTDLLGPESGVFRGVLEHDWDQRSIDLAGRLVSPKNETLIGVQKTLANIISGPFDCDKLDYLIRDASHTSCPYPRGIDEERLLAALQMVKTSDGVALGFTYKARAAVELLTFTRYIMFTELYWHHAARIAMRMLQEIVRHMGDHIKEELYQQLLRFGDDDLLSWLGTKAKSGTAAAELLDMLQQRKLYKRLLTLSSLGAGKNTYKNVRNFLDSKDPNGRKMLEAEVLSRINSRTGLSLPAHQVLVDFPFAREGDELSGLYMQQKNGDVVNLVDPEAESVVSQFGKSFLNNAKKLRIVVHPELLNVLESRLHPVEGTVYQIINESISRLLGRPVQPQPSPPEGAETG